MYTQLWSKYLPIIRILIKRSATQDQLLDLDVTDFDRAGIARKAGNKFNLIFSNGKATNSIGSSPLAKDLITTLLDDAIVKELFTQNEYHITVNTKYKLSIKCIQKVEEEVLVAEEAAAL